MINLPFNLHGNFLPIPPRPPAAAACSTQRKDDGVFGTLNILVPCVYTGGKLVVAYENEALTFDLADGNEFSAHYVACYAGR